MGRKIISTLLTMFLIVTMLCGTVYAKDKDDAGDTNEHYIEFEEVYIDGDLITVPVEVVVREDSKLSRSSEDRNIVQENTYYIPVTEEGQAYNEELVNNSKLRGTATDTYLDPRQYLTATSIIRYTMYSNNTYVLINNVAITRNKNPESVTNGGYLYGIGTPSARVVCVGGTATGGAYTQDTTLTLNWGTSGVNTPSSWVPVMCGSYSDQYRGFAQYSFNLIYRDGTVNCAFTHTLAK